MISPVIWPLEVPDKLVPTNFLGVGTVTRDKARETLGSSPIALRPKEGYVGGLCVCAGYSQVLVNLG